MSRYPSRIARHRRLVCYGLVAVVVCGVSGDLIGFNRIGQGQQVYAETTDDENDEQGMVEEADDFTEDDPEDSDSSSNIGGAAKKLKLSGRKLKEKQRQVQIVVLLFMGIVILGIAMFASLLLYGSWMRRMNRGRPAAANLAAELEKIKNSSRDLSAGQRSAENRPTNSPSDGKV